MHNLNIKTISRFDDSDQILLHAAFTILCNFIEIEKPVELSGDDLNSEGAVLQNDDLLRLRCLYYWWKYERPKYMTDPKLVPMSYSDRYQLDTDRLAELVSLRENMWT